MNKFRSMTPSSRARKRREQESAADHVSSRPVTPGRPAYSRSSTGSVGIAGDHGDTHDEATLPVVAHKRLNSGPTSITSPTRYVTQSALSCLHSHIKK